MIDVGDNDPGTVLASGDSVTYGYDSTSFRGYRLDLERLMAEQGRAVSVINGGRPGVRSHNFALLRQDLTRFNPAVVVLQYGVNDALVASENTPTAVVGNLRIMINEVLANRSIAVLTTLTPTCGYRDGQNSVIDRINEGFREMVLEFEDFDDVVFADVSAAFKEADPAGEGCALISPVHQNHPNNEGYRLMAEVIAASLESVSW